MLGYENVIGKQEDWADYITNVENRETPFLDWLPLDKEPQNNIKDYQMDKYRAPRENRHVDGQPWKNFESGAENRGRAKAMIQWLDATVSVSLLAEDNTNDAAIASQIAYEIPKKMVEMKQDWEVAMLEDSDHVEDNKVEGYRTRGVGSWVDSSAQTLFPVPSAFRTPSASIVSTSIATVTESAVRTMLQNSWLQTKSSEEMTGFVGIDLKNWYADRQYFIPSSAATQSTGVVSQNVFKDKTITRAIDYYKADGVMVSLVLTPWLVGLTGSTTGKAGRGYYLHRSKWKMAWKQKPKVYRPEFKGGSYEAAMDMIAMLYCTNPLGECKQNPS